MKDAERVLLCQSHQRYIVNTRQFNGLTGGNFIADHHRNPAPNCLLYHIHRNSSAGKKDAGRQIHAREQSFSNRFIYGIMPAQILAGFEHRIFPRQKTAVGGPGLSMERHTCAIR